MAESVERGQTFLKLMEKLQEVNISLKLSRLASG